MFGKFKKTIEKGAGFEAMPVPNIEITRERGLEIGTQLIKDNKWTENREVLHWLSIIYDHPEWKNEIIQKIKKDKEFIENPEKLCERILSDIKEGEKEIDLADLNSELKGRAELIPVYKEKIKDLIKYFRPDKKTSNIENVRIVAADTITGKESGYGIFIGNTNIIVSHSENLLNFEHEFLHSIINPITEKIKNKLSDVEKEIIVGLAGNKLKKQGYVDAISFLNEEIIRTYNNFIETDKAPITFDDFKKMVDGIKDSSFSIIQEKNVERFKELGIESVADLRLKSDEYYKNFYVDELADKIYNLHLEYKKKSESDKNLSFEQYFLENFRKILD